MRFGKFVLFRFLHKNRKPFSFILIHRFLCSAQVLFSARVQTSENIIMDLAHLVGLEQISSEVHRWKDFVDPNCK